MCSALLTDFDKVKQHWGTAGTLADMKMTAATATLLKCQADEFYRLEDMWTGGLVQTFCFSAGCFVMFPPQISVLFHTMLTTCLNRNKPCRVFLPHWIGGDEPATEIE